MTPAVAILYSGLSPAKNALSIYKMVFLAYAVVAIQWVPLIFILQVLFGFSLAFSESGSGFIGDFAMAGLFRMGDQSLPLTAPSVSAISFSFYQMQFAAVTGK
jgi:Amt family ammonium transporter